ncbi:hypothetical protein CHH80_16820 [Bacillus sp. 7504-2]|nr:hypothetical protein CHH80_16820 [Bacillus sp. 7504-2]
MQLLFKPAKVLLNKFSFFKKFLVLFVVVFFTLSFLISTIVSNIYSEIAFTKEERTGVELFQKIYPLIQSAQQHRGLSVNVLSGERSANSSLEEVEEKLNNDLHSLSETLKELGHLSTVQEDVTALLSDWETVKRDALSLTIPESIELHNQFIDAMFRTLLNISDETNLSLDSTLINNHLINLLKQTLPHITEFMGKSRAIGVGVATKREVTDEEHNDLTYLLKMMEEYITQGERTYEIVFNLEPSLENTIGTFATNSIAEAKQITQIIENDLLAATISIEPELYFDKTTDTINSIFELLTYQTDELDKLLTAQIKQLTNQLYLTVTLVFAIIIALGYLLISFYLAIKEQVASIQSITAKISEGDLLKTVPITSKDEFGIIGEAINKMLSSFKKVLHNSQEVSQEVAAASEQLLAITEETTKATFQITNSVETVTSIVGTQADEAKANMVLMEDFTQKLSHISSISHEVGTTTSLSSEEAENGNGIVEDTIKQMEVIHQSVRLTANVIEQLGTRSKQIEGILNAITAIAEQTNLLSLNAAIEAARAGEHGKGFAVVANEVRQLADDSSKSVEQIRTLVRAIQTDTLNSIESMEKVTTETAAGMNLISKTGETFSTIADSTKNVAHEVQKIVSSINSMLTQANQLRNSIENVAKQTEMTEDTIQSVAAATEEQLASMEEVTSSVDSLSMRAQQLQEMIEDFKL